MKHLQLLFLGLYIWTTAFSQNKIVQYATSSAPKEIIKANKIIREEIHLYTFDKSAVKDSALTIIYYDTIGNIVEEKLAKTKNSDETITKYGYFYNPSGKLLKQITDKPKGMGRIYEYEYDSLGNEITKYDYNKDTTRLTIEHKKYNEKKQVTELLIKINNTDPYISKRYYYNQGNELSKIEALDRKGIVIYSYLYEYDKLANKKTVYLKNEEGTKMMEEYIYNTDMLCIKMKSITKHPVFISKDVTEYQDLNKITENIYNTNKTLMESTVLIDGKRTQMERHYYFKE